MNSSRKCKEFETVRATKARPNLMSINVVIKNYNNRGCDKLPVALENSDTTNTTSVITIIGDVGSKSQTLPAFS